MPVPGYTSYPARVRMNAAGTKGYFPTNNVGVQVFDATTNTMTTAIPIRDASAIVFSPDGSKVYIVERNYRVNVVDADTDVITDTWDFGAEWGSLGVFGTLKIDPSGSIGYLAGFARNVVYVLDLAAGSITDTIEVGVTPESMVLTKDGKTLYVNDSFHRQVKVLDTTTRSVVRGFDANIGYQTRLSPSEDRMFGTHVNQSRVNVTDLTTDALICSHVLFPLHRNSPGDIALSPDGRKMYVAIADHPDSKVAVVPIPEEPNLSFRDVPIGAQFDREIRWMGNAGISTGYEDGTYRPLQPVHRDAMAAFLYRFHGSPEFVPPSTSPFVDVKPGDKFYKEIAWLASQRIATGWPDGTFRPLNPINRDAMAAFLCRVAPDCYNYRKPDESPYIDVRTTDQFYREMAFMSDSGISEGWPDGTYRPLQSVNRDAMAAFLYRLNPQSPAINR